MARPSSFTQEIADQILERLMDGESLRTVCSDEGMPNRATVFRWLAADKAFRDQYALAREVQAEALFDDILRIADDGENDWMTKRRGELEIEVVNHEAIHRSRLRVDVRRWMAGKLAPKKYGEATSQREAAGDGPPTREQLEDDRPVLAPDEEIPDDPVL